AINVGISVSRVGGKAQTKAMKKIAGRLRLDLAQYRELAAFAQFGSDLDKATLAQLTRGEKMTEILKQDQYVPMKLEDQVAIIFAGVNGLLDSIPTAELKRFERELLQYLSEKHPDIPKEIGTSKELTDSTAAKLKQAVEDFKGKFRA
ncbi:MAG TPA: F0F1 ATP synthase subunit alpha, partial [bacterium]|nr:F0F1 ATP synthase subunit alpha [bacterium]